MPYTIRAISIGFVFGGLGAKGAWNLALIFNVGSFWKGGAWCLRLEAWRLGGWRLEAWMLEAGGWRLKAGGW